MTAKKQFRRVVHAACLGAAALTCPACDQSPLSVPNAGTAGSLTSTSATAATTTTVVQTSAGSTSVVLAAPLDAVASATLSREASVQRRADELRRQLDANFHIRGEWPFVAAGDTARAHFDAVFEHSLLACYRCLRRDYFATEPTHVITVFLFKDDASYRRGALELLGDRADTPFGYYSSRHRALVMNIGTGTGTLIHELCHALIERDFPRCPTWFNEGLASLHEQCAHRDGSLVGLPNWRLPGLQKAIRAGTSLPLEQLLAKTDSAGFYEDDKGLNYATARYLCQYVQSRGKLKAFYAQLKRDLAKDPTGRKTLESLLSLSLPDIERDWQRWVITLRFDK